MSIEPAETDGLLEVLLETVRLKALPRAGWVRAGVPSPESVAGHSWGVAWLVLALLPDELDRGRALAYAVLHDLPEVRVGDLTPHDAVSAAEKIHREHQAIHALTRRLAPRHLADLWDSYESQSDDEARFVRQLDRLDMAVQALAHHRAGRGGMEEFVRSAEAVVVHPALSGLMRAIVARFRGSSPVPPG